jgi:hypothetical protein
VSPGARGPGSDSTKPFCTIGRAPRRRLAGSLLESLDTQVDEDAEAAWAIEVNRRIAELDSRAAKSIPWAEVRRRFAAR